MRRSPVLVALLAAISVCLLAAPAGAATRVVDPATGPYTTITDALHAADPGDTIDIHQGHYDEQLWVDKDNLTLHAAPATIVSSTASWVVSLMGAGDKLDGLTVAGVPGGVRIEGDGAQLVDTSVLADVTAVSVKGPIHTRMVRSMLRATALTGTALLARNDAPAAQSTTLATAILVGGRQGTAMDVLTGEVGDTTPTGAANVDLTFSTVANAPTALRTGRAGLGGPVAVRAEASIVHGDAPALVLSGTDTSTPDADTFVDAPALDFHLRAGVPSIDRLLVSPLPLGAEVDFGGGPRVLGRASDPGAFEFVNHVPTAALSASAATAGQNVAVSFDASASADPDPGGRIVSYLWAFGDGTPSQTTTTPTVSHAFTAVGRPTVTVRVADQQGAAASSEPVAVVVTDAVAPALSITSPRDGARLHRYRTVRRAGRRHRVVNVLRFGGRSADAGGVAGVDLWLRQVPAKAAATCRFLDVTTRRVVRRACGDPPVAHAAISGGAWSWHTPARLAVPAGRWELTVRASDRAGNLASGLLHFSVT